MIFVFSVCIFREMGKEEVNVQLIYPKDNRVPEDVCRLRNDIGVYVSWLLENVFEVQQDHYVEMSVIGASEGFRSACIKVAVDNRDACVVKMALTDFITDTEALRAWKKVGVRTPEVICTGEFPKDLGGGGLTAHYLIMELLSQADGAPPIDGYPFLDGNFNRQQVGEFGNAAGVLLANAHMAVASGETFGGRDIQKAETYYQMLERLVMDRTEQLDLGVLLNGRASVLLKEVSTSANNSPGVWVHNDFGPHNLLVLGNNPIQLALIDPIAIVAHPYWDLATAANRLAWLRIRGESEPDNDYYKFKLDRDEWYYEGLICGYQQFTGDDINSPLLRVSQIGQLLWKICHTEKDGFYLHNENMVRIHNLRKRLLARLLLEKNTSL